MYYKEREPRKFDFDCEPPKGPGKKVIHMIILLLFLIAVIIFFFPSSRGSDERGGADPNAENAENTEFSSAGVAGSDDVFRSAFRLA
jgi:hypothetical protein